MSDETKDPADLAGKQRRIGPVVALSALVLVVVVLMLVLALGIRQQRVHPVQVDVARASERR